MAADPVCHQVECLTAVLIYAGVEFAVCLPFAPKTPGKTLCSSAVGALGSQAFTACKKVVEICDGKDAGAFHTIQTASCTSAHSCGFSSNALDKSALQFVDGFYIYHIGGYISYEVEYIHSGSVNSRLVTITPDGYRMYGTDAWYTGTDPTSRRFTCSTYLTVDATAYVASGKQPRALIMVSKPSTFRTEAECGRTTA